MHPSICNMPTGFVHDPVADRIAAARERIEGGRAEAYHVSRGGARAEGDVAPTVTGQGGAGRNRHGAGWSGTDLTVVDAPATFVKRRSAGKNDPSPETWGETDVARTVSAADAHRQDSAPAHVLDAHNQSDSGDVAPAIRGSIGSPQSQNIAVDPGELDGCREGAACALDPPPDGRRYAACGDGVASVCTHWIGLRLRAVHEGRDPEAACAERWA